MILSGKLIISWQVEITKKTREILCSFCYNIKKSHKDVSINMPKILYFQYKHEQLKIVINYYQLFLGLPPSVLQMNMLQMLSPNGRLQNLPALNHLLSSGLAMHAATGMNIPKRKTKWAWCSISNKYSQRHFCTSFFIAM